MAPVKTKQVPKDGCQMYDFFKVTVILFIYEFQEKLLFDHI